VLFFSIGYVITKVVLFVIVAFKTDILQGSAATHLRCGEIFNSSYY